MSLQAWDRVRLAASLIGLGIAAYLSALHYDTAVSLVCSSSGAVNCERVLTSPQAVWNGIPVALWGMIWFAVAATLAILSLVRHGAAEPPWLRWGGIGWAVIGAAAVLRLLYTELVVIGSICLWCTAVHVLVIGLFVVQMLTDATRTSTNPEP
ncbi:MAG TPA: vitamin K epoxide reductase family protein [bacterium]|nr:vitamin K epoxide reductase family protein [bacterium]